jgi:hypothetical protein
MLLCVGNRYDFEKIKTLTKNIRQKFKKNYSMNILYSKTYRYVRHNVYLHVQERLQSFSAAKLPVPGSKSYKNHTYNLYLLQFLTV